MRDQYRFVYLDTNGDQTGSISAVGDYSVAADDFFFTSRVPTEIHRMLVTVRDTGAFDAEQYGNGLALTNGIQVLVENAGSSPDIVLNGQETVKTNADWGSLCYDVDVKTWGTGDEVMLVRWTFAKSGKPLELSYDDRLIVRLNDNFSTLVDHRFMVQGIVR